MYNEEVVYKNKKSNLNISGTLTLPEGKTNPPVIILVAGLGPNDRDYNLFGNKLFLHLSEHLASCGMAVLRYDKRGIGKSEGRFSLRLTSQDLADDLSAGIDYLNKRDDIDSKNIGLLGHSEGGMISNMVAASREDISFLISLVGLVTTGLEEAIEQMAMQLRADGMSEDIIEQDGDLRRRLLEAVKKEEDFRETEKFLYDIAEQYLPNLPEGMGVLVRRNPFIIDKNNYKKTIKLFNSPWYRFLINYNPVQNLEKIKVPMLAIYGGCDFIVSSKISLTVIEGALCKSGNKDVKTVEIPKLNHWLQKVKTGATSEYVKAEETIAPEVLSLISSWILKS